MKSIKHLAHAAAIAALTLLTACSSYKNVPYMMNSREVSLDNTTLYDAKIMPKDILTITVNCPEDPMAAADFNLVTQTTDIRQGSNGNLSTAATLQSYLVSNEGDINFPMLGKLKVAGMTKTQLEDDIANRIYGTYLKTRPIVLVNMANYKVSVLGEVARPGTYNASNGRINLLEALSLAGDLTIWGLRDNVKIIREYSDGKKQIVELNLNDANIINSPFYQLQQNDIVYVTPNKTKSKNSDVGQSTSLWFSATSIVVSLASLLYNILK